MDPRSLATGEKNDLASAVRRVETAGRIWQAFTAFDLNSYGLGHTTFRLEDSNTDYKKPVVHIVRSSKTLNELYTADGNQMYNMISDSIKQDPLFRKRTPGRALHVACLILDSHWDNNQKKLLGHAALGGGGGDIMLGIFGSHLTHGWPENFRQLISRMSDNHLIDRNAVAYDASPTKFQSFNVGVGAFLHEAGHLLGIPENYPFGLMGRGMDFFNRAFMTVEAFPEPDTRFKAIKFGSDDVQQTWGKEQSMILEKNVCFKPLTQREIKYEWRRADGKGAFLCYQDSGAEWTEVDNEGRPGSRFMQIRFVSRDDCLLFDKGRNMYVKITNDRLFWGNSIDQTNYFLYSGKWIKSL